MNNRNSPMNVLKRRIMNVTQYLAGILLYLTVASAWADIYVSPSGKDTNPGTEAAPLCTLARARDLVRPLLQDAKGDLHVWLEGGVYPVTAPILFTAGDSGKYKVIYAAAPGARPIFSSGKLLTGWSLYDASKNIWMAPVSPGDNFRQMYVDGVKAVRARSDGPLGLRTTSTGFAFPAPMSFRRPADLEIVASPHQWQQERLPVAAISGSEVTIQQPCWKIVSHGEYPGYQKPQWLENAFEFLTHPGYWYLDRTAARVYYIPRSGENMADARVEIPTAEQLIVLSGNASAPVENLEFSGIDFRMTNWLRPSSGAGFPLSQANQPEPQKSAWAVKAAVDCTGARDCVFRNCHFYELGGNGVNVLTASQRVRVERCEFHNIAGTAVQIGRGSSVDMALKKDSPDIISECTVADCTIHDTATDYQSGCGIFAGLVRNCTFEHNELFNLPYTGISLGWGWRRTLAFTSGNKIIGNKIHDHMRKLGDGGGIYCNGYEENGLIEGNYVYGQGNVFGAYYLDDGSTNWNVKDNVCKKGHAQEWFLFKGHNNHASDNFTDDARTRDMSDHTIPCTIERTTVVTNGVWPPQAIEIMNTAGPRGVSASVSGPSDSEPRQ